MQKGLGNDSLKGYMGVKMRGIIFFMVCCLSGCSSSADTEAPYAAQNSRSVNWNESYNGMSMDAAGKATVYGSTNYGSYKLESSFDGLNYKDDTTFDDGSHRYQEGNFLNDGMIE